MRRHASSTMTTKTKPSKKYRTDSVEHFLADVLDTRFFDPSESEDGIAPLTASLQHGKGKLVVVTGENASGKSLLRRLVCAVLHKADVECIHTSQEKRSNGGIERAFIYGTEIEESTGYISTHAITGAIRTSKARENRHALYLDEPDIGLSDGYAASAGILIRDFMREPPDKLMATFVVSHNKALIRQLAEIEPWHLRMGDEQSDLNAWLDAPITPLNIEELREKHHDRFRRVSALLKD